MTMKNVFFIMLAMLASGSAKAQSTFDMSGTVVEKTTGEAVVAATIQLMTLPDSTFVEGTTTGEQGQFGFKDVKKGEYALKVSYIGFDTKYVNINLQDQKKKKIEMGYITMSADAVALEGVEIKGNASKVAVSGDSLVYNHIETIENSFFQTQSSTHVSDLSNWLFGMHRHILPKYIQGYLDEYYFRFNRRENKIMAFDEFIGLLMMPRPNRKTE